MTAYLGEIAALLTSLCFSATSTFFTLSGRRVGSVVVNRTRLLFALLFLGSAHLLVSGSLLPMEAGWERWLWLGLSGVIGLVIGDAFLFQAFVLIGPRLSMLMMSLVPVIGALQARIFLGETLTYAQIFGMALTLTGISWVILERNGANTSERAAKRTFLLGLLFALGGAAGQATGLVTAKFGLAQGFSPLSANVIRMSIAALVLWTTTVLRRQAGPTFNQWRLDRKALRFIFLGSFTGPFLGVSLSLVAIQQTSVGIASTLMALPPVFLLPVGYYVFGERFGWQAVAGTLLTVTGVAILFLV